MRPTVHGRAGGWGWTWTSPAGAPARPLGLLVGELRVRPVDRFAGGLPVWNAPFAAAVMSLPHGALRPELCLCHDCLSSCRWTHAPEAGVKDGHYGCGCHRRDDGPALVGDAAAAALSERSSARRFLSKEDTRTRTWW